MKKFLLSIIIFFLIISTTIIKNSTKKIEDDIFSTEENLRALNINYNEVLLEHNYLSSSEKLLEFQSLYFENELAQKNLNEILLKLIFKFDLFFL